MMTTLVRSEHFINNLYSIKKIIESHIDFFSMQIPELGEFLTEDGKLEKQYKYKTLKNFSIILNNNIMLQKTLTTAYIETINFIDNPTEELQKFLVNKDGMHLKYLSKNQTKPSDKIKKMAVKQNGMAIEFINNPSEEIQKIAVTQHPEAINEIDDPTLEVINQSTKIYAQYLKNMEDLEIKLENSKSDEKLIMCQQPTITTSAETLDIMTIKAVKMIASYLENLGDLNNFKYNCGYKLEDIVHYRHEALLYILYKLTQVYNKMVEEYKGDSKQSETSITKHKNISELKGLIYELQEMITSRNGLLISFLPNPCVKIQTIALKQNGHALYFVQKLNNKYKKVGKNPEEIALEQNGYAIKYIENPCQKLINIAVSQNGLSIKYVNEPSKIAIDKALKQNGMAIKYIKSPSKAQELLAIKQNGMAIKYIINPSKELISAAISQNGLAIKYIENPDDDAKNCAINQRGDAIEFITNPTKRHQINAVAQEGYLIKFITNPSPEVQQIAVKNDILAATYIENPCDEILPILKQTFEIESTCEIVDTSEKNVPLFEMFVRSKKDKF